MSDHWFCSIFFIESRKVDFQSILSVVSALCGSHSDLITQSYWNNCEFRAFLVIGSAILFPTDFQWIIRLLRSWRCVGLFICWIHNWIMCNKGEKGLACRVWIRGFGLDHNWVGERIIIVHSAWVVGVSQNPSGVCVRPVFFLSHSAFQWVEVI